MSDFFPKHKRSTLTQVALDNSRMAIDSGHLKPGQRIVESQLAKEMAISRFPIREALRYLEQEGMVVIEPFKGVRVASISRKDLHDLMTVRCALEELAIRLFIRNLTDESMEMLEDTLTEMEAALATEDVERIVSSDLRFHECICEYSGNPRLLNSWRPLARQIKVCLKMEYPLFQFGKDFVATHLPIIEAINDRDEARAEKLLQQHIYSALDRIGDSIESATVEPKQPRKRKAPARKKADKS